MGSAPPPAPFSYHVTLTLATSWERTDKEAFRKKLLFLDKIKKCICVRYVFSGSLIHKKDNKQV